MTIINRAENPLCGGVESCWRNAPVHSVKNVIFRETPACFMRSFPCGRMQYFAGMRIYLNEKKVKNGHVFYLFVFLHFLT